MQFQNGLGFIGKERVIFFIRNDIFIIHIFNVFNFAVFIKSIIKWHPFHLIRIHYFSNRFISSRLACFADDRNICIKFDSFVIGSSPNRIGCVNQVSVYINFQIIAIAVLLICKRISILCILQIGILVFIWRIIIWSYNTE